MDPCSKHFIFRLIKNQIPFTLIQTLSMLPVPLIGPNQVGLILWIVFVLLVLIILITFNSTRNPGSTDSHSYLDSPNDSKSRKKGSPTWWASWWASFVKEWAYEHPSLIEQLNMGWRTFELDFHMR